LDDGGEEDLGGNGGLLRASGGVSRMKAKKLSLKLHLQMYSLIYHVSFICTKEGLDRYITYVFYWKTKIS